MIWIVGNLDIEQQGSETERVVLIQRPLRPGSSERSDVCNERAREAHQVVEGDTWGQFCEGEPSLSRVEGTVSALTR